MVNKKVIYLGSYEGFEATKKVLDGIATVEHIKACQEALSLAIISADAVIDASMKVNISNEMVLNAQNLKVISCATTGSDHIDREELLKRNIPVKTLKEDSDILSNITPAAELSWALLIACARRLPAAVEHVKHGNWVREEFPGIMLNGKSLGLIGCGRIGGWMAKYAQAFGMKIIGVDPYLKEWPEIIEKATIEEVMQKSDFISIHVHLSDDTRGLISKDLLSMTKKEVIIINTSRGAIIDEEALLNGLKLGHIKGVGLDVLVGEPDIAKHPLVQYAKEHDNVLITPHCGGFSPDAVKIVCAHAAKKIVPFINL